MVLHFVNQENKVVLLVQMAESSLRYMAHRSTWMEVERGSKQRSLQPSPFYWRGNVCQWLSLWIQCSAFITEFSPQPFRLLLPSAWYPHISRETVAQAVLPIKPRSENWTRITMGKGWSKSTLDIRAYGFVRQVPCQSVKCDLRISLQIAHQEIIYSAWFDSEPLVHVQ